MEQCIRVAPPAGRAGVRNTTETQAAIDMLILSSRPSFGPMDSLQGWPVLLSYNVIMVFGVGLGGVWEEGSKNIFVHLQKEYRPHPPHTHAPPHLTASQPPWRLEEKYINLVIDE